MSRTFRGPRAGAAMAAVVATVAFAAEAAAQTMQQIQRDQARETRRFFEEGQRSAPSAPDPLGGAFDSLFGRVIEQGLQRGFNAPADLGSLFGAPQPPQSQAAPAPRPAQQTPGQATTQGQPAGTRAPAASGQGQAGGNPHALPPGLSPRLPAGDAWMVASSHADRTYAVRLATAASRHYAATQVFQDRAGKFVIVVGAETEQKAAEHVARLKREGKLPPEAHTHNGSSFIGRVWASQLILARERHAATGVPQPYLGPRN